MNEPRHTSFEEFWPFYVSQHASSLNRTLHFVGTSLAMGTAAVGLLTGQKKLLLLAPVLGYGPAWVGHFLVERGNTARPFVQCGQFIAGQIECVPPFIGLCFQCSICIDLCSAL